MGCEMPFIMAKNLKCGLKKGDKCIKCNKPASVYLPYGPQKFCDKHFIQLIEKRFRKTIRKYSLIRKGEHLLVAVSGGKDSLTALYLTKKYFGKQNKITALLIDEGISGYRDKALKIAMKNCKKWRIPYKHVSFKTEFGIGMSHISKKISKTKKNFGSMCSFCGTMRRTLMNRYAKKLSADKLITGHNLDDELQSILMNACDNDIARFFRSGPLAGVKQIPDLVQRVKPLCEIPEAEIFLYANYVGIEHYSGSCCPFRAKAKRNIYRKILNELEEHYPGTKYSLWNFYIQLRVKFISLKILSGIELNKCKKCGEPSTKEICDTCKKLSILKN
ncbi:MAG: TIGR00269 family protein [Candidatus Diapherotrites archaeon]|nr:TIGR00269 family protein [Candidatus Diapherotrites archaeon]